MAAIDQINLVTQDMDASIAFYRLLGAKIPASAVWRTKTGAHHCHVDVGGVSLHLDSVALAKKYNKGYRKARGGALIIGFSLPTRKAVDTAFAKVTGAGHRGLQEPFDAFWGARYAIVADPDGNHIGLMSPSEDKYRSRGPDL